MTAPRAEQALDCDGMILPPVAMRQGVGAKDPAVYLAVAKGILDMARDLAWLRPSDRVLDLGCGAGRFLTALLAEFGRINRYVGLDVRRDVIEWCRTALAKPEFGDVRFDWIDVANHRYHAIGERAAHEVRLPAADGAFDFVMLWSVFSHMTPDDTAWYLKETRRFLADGGRCLLTAFVEDGVEAWTENPVGYLEEWRGPLHCARFNRKSFDAMIGDAGLSVATFAYRRATQSASQSIYVLRKP
jgi:SAM-dependent methyltransferase